jgi:hypothetical protein
VLSSWFFWLRFVGVLEWFMRTRWCGSTDPTMMRTEFHLRSNLMASDGSRVCLPPLCRCLSLFSICLCWHPFFLSSRSQRAKINVFVFGSL